MMRNHQSNFRTSHGDDTLAAFASAILEHKEIMQASWITHPPNFRGFYNFLKCSLDENDKWKWANHGFAAKPTLLHTLSYLLRHDKNLLRPPSQGN